MKRQVKESAESLAAMLMRRGMKIKIVVLPLDSTKTGLDDFIVAKAKNAAREYAKLERYLPETVAKVLALNDEFMFVVEPTAYLHLDSMKLKSQKQFEQIIDNRKVKTETIKNYKDGPVAITIEQKLSKVWRESDLRAEAKTITWLPEKPRGFDDDGVFNTYKPPPIVPVKGDVGWYKRLKTRLLDGQDATLFDYIENQIAYKFANPGAKIPSYICLTGPEGSGKTLWGLCILKLFSPYATEIPGTKFTAKFNMWAAYKLVVMVSELMQKDSRQASDLLKMMFSQTTIHLEPKGIDSFEMPDRVFYIITTNHPNPLYVPSGDRRGYFLRVCPNTPLSQVAPADDSLFKDVYAALEDPKAIAALAYYFAERAKALPANYNPFAAPPMTDAKEDAIASSFTQLEDFCRELIANPDELWIDGYTVENGRYVPLRKKKCDFAEAIDILGAYQRYMGIKSPQYNVSQTNPTAVGMAMRRIGATKFTQIGDGRKTLWCIRNLDSWKKREKKFIVQHYNETVLGLPKFTAYQGRKTDNEDDEEVA